MEVLERRRHRLLPFVFALLAASGCTRTANAAFLPCHHSTTSAPRRQFNHVKTEEPGPLAKTLINRARGYRLVQHSRKQYSFARIKTNTQRTYNNDPDNSSLVVNDDDLDGPLLLQTTKKSKSSPEEEYRVVSDSERETKALKHSQNKNKNKKKKTITKPAQQQLQQQPAWVLPIVQLQDSLEEFKQDVHARINEPIVETVEALLILLSSILVAITTLPDIPWDILGRVETVQQGLSVLFFTEFTTRWFSSNEKRGKFVTQPLVLVDFVVVVLPFLLTAVPSLDSMFPDVLSGQSGLINLRLLRVLRLQRVLTDELSFSRFVYSLQWDDNASGVIVQQWELRLARVVLSIFTLLSVAAGLIYTTEHAVNEGISDYFSALYFTLTTLTTVGFGDIVPVTWQGRLAVSASILAGVAIIPSQAAALVEALLEREDEKQRERGEDTSNNRVSSVTNNMAAQNNNIHVNSQKKSDTATAMLEEAQKCPICKVGLHWSHATYCYNCASPLRTSTTETTSLLLPDKS